MRGVADAGEVAADRLGLGGRRAENAEAVEDAIGRRAAPRRPSWPPRPPPRAPAPARSTIRRSMSTNRPESGRFDQVVSAVTWNSTIRPLPRRSAVTSGVPSASRAQVLAARPGSGSASTWRDTVTSSGAARPKNGLSLSKGAMCLGVSHDSAPPSVRPPRLSAVGVRSSVAGGEAGAGEAQQHAARFDEVDQLVARRAGRRRSCRRARAPTASRRERQNRDRWSRHAARGFRRRARARA